MADPIEAPAAGAPAAARAAYLGVSFFALLVLLLEAVAFHLLNYVHDYLAATLVISFTVLGIGGGAFWASRTRMEEGAAFALACLGTPLCIYAAIGAVFLFYPALWLSALAISLLFVFPAFYIALIFKGHRGDRVYLFDMVGAGLGVVLTVALYELLHSETILLVAVTLLPLVGIGHSLWGKPRGGGLPALAAFGLLFVTGTALLAANGASDALNPFRLMAALGRTAPAHELEKAFHRVGADRLVRSYDNLTARLDVLTGRERHVVAWNGFGNDNFNSRVVPEYETHVKPRGIRWPTMDRRVLYGVAAEPEVFVFGPGADGILKSLKQITPAGNITAVEINPAIVRMMQRDFAEESGGSYRGLQPVVGNALAVLASSRRAFDIITLINTHSTRTLSYQGAPDNLHTLESYGLYFDRLKPEGYILFEERPVTRRGELALYRMLHTLYQCLQARGAEDPARHFVIWEWMGDRGDRGQIRKNRDDYYVSLIASAAPITGEMRAKVLEWVFNCAYGKESVRVGYFKDFYENDEFRRLFAMMAAGDFAPLRPEAFDATVATYDRPFLQMATTDNPRLRGLLAWTGGLALALLALLVLAVARGSARPVAGLSLSAYNVAIGAAFFLIEIVLLQSYQSLFVSPTATLILVLGLLLISSGVGGFFSGRLGLGACALLLVPVAAGALWAPRLMLATGAPFALVKLVCVALVCAAGFLMGVFFPKGLLLAGRLGLRQRIPHFFAINSVAGSFAVIAAFALGVKVGYQATVALALLLYILSWRILSAATAAAAAPAPAAAARGRAAQKRAAARLLLPLLLLAGLLAPAAVAADAQWAARNAAGVKALQAGELAAAEVEFKAALKRAEQAKDPQAQGISLANLAAAGMAAGKSAEAEAHLKKALALMQKVPGPPSPETANIYNNLAVLALGRGEMKEAERLLKKALEAWEKTLGLAHPRALPTLGNYAHLLRATGREAAARELEARWGRPDPRAVAAAARLAASYLARTTGASGRFVYLANLDPAVAVPPAEYNIVRHGGTMYALASYAQLYGGEEEIRALERAGAFLRAQAIRPIPGRWDLLAVWSLPGVTDTVDREQVKLGGTALGLAGLVGLETLRPGSTPLAVLRGLASFILYMQKEDGSFYSKFIPDKGGRDDSWTSLFYPGEAALALLLLHAVDPQPQWLEGAARAMAYLARIRQGRADVPPDHWALLATAHLLPLYEQTSRPAPREAIVAHAAQVSARIAADARRGPVEGPAAGAFTPDAGTTPTATRLEGLLAALSFLPPEHGALREQIATLAHRGIGFLLGAQIREGAHAGGLPRSGGAAPDDPEEGPGQGGRRDPGATEIRIDYVQHALSALLQYQALFHSAPGRALAQGGPPAAAPAQEDDDPAPAAAAGAGRQPAPRPAAGGEEPFAAWIAGQLAQLKWPQRAWEPRLDRETLERSLALGRRFIIGQQKEDGNFLYQYDFLRRAASHEDNQVRQAGTLWALALLVRRAPDPAGEAALRRGLEFFFKATRPGPAPGSLLIAYPGDPVCRTGTVALVGLSLVEYLRADREGKVRLEAGYRRELEERLAGYLEHLVSLQLENRHFSQAVSVQTGRHDPGFNAYFDGETILCLVKAAKYLGHDRLLPLIDETVLVLARHYTLEQWRREPGSANTKGFFQWGCMAFWEYQDAGWRHARPLGDTLLTLGWWMIHVHRTLERPRNTGYAHEGLIHAYRLARARGLEPAASDLAHTIDQGLHKLTTWQVGGPLAGQNPFLAANPTADPLALGGAMNARDDPALRIDVTQHQMHAVMLALDHVYAAGGPRAAAPAAAPPPGRAAEEALCRDAPAPTGPAVLFAGDTHFGENYQERLAAQGGANLLRERGYAHSLEALRPLVCGASLAVVNLETPLVPPGRSPLEGRKRYIHHGDPERVPGMLAAMRVAAAALANNHAMDHGPAGLAHTLEALAAGGIRAIGAGEGERAGPFHAVLGEQAGAFPLAVAAGMAYEPGQGDGPAEEGIRLWDPQTAAADIRAARRRHPQAFLVAFPHWGRNYQWRTPAQAELGRALIDAGADLVLGHGAHMLQEIERYKDRWIVYSLGNFVFNAPGRYAQFKAPPFSLAALLEAEWRGGGGRPRETALRLYPIVTDNLLTGYRPRPATAEEFAAVRGLLLPEGPPPAGVEPGADAAGPFLRLRIVAGR